MKQHLQPDLQDPSFSLVTGVCGTTRTVTVEGEIDIAVRDRLAGDLRAVIAGEPETVVVDLGGVAFIDSTGVHALLGAHQHAVARGVHLVMLPPSPRVFRTFEVSGLDTVLPFVGAPAV